jgi:hypothetical protein
MCLQHAGSKPCRRLLGLSNMKVMVSPLSSAFIVTMSSLPAHFMIFARLLRLMPASVDMIQHRSSYSGVYCIQPRSRPKVCSVVNAKQLWITIA